MNKEGSNAARKQVFREAPKDAVIGAQEENGATFDALRFPAAFPKGNIASAEQTKESVPAAEIVEDIKKIIIQENLGEGAEFTSFHATPSHREGEFVVTVVFNGGRKREITLNGHLVNNADTGTISLEGLNVLRDRKGVGSRIKSKLEGFDFGSEVKARLEQRRKRPVQNIQIQEDAGPVAELDAPPTAELVHEAAGQTDSDVETPGLPEAGEPKILPSQEEVPAQTMSALPTESAREQPENVPLEGKFIPGNVSRLPLHKRLNRSPQPIKDAKYVRADREQPKETVNKPETKKDNGAQVLVVQEAKLTAPQNAKEDPAEKERRSTRIAELRNQLHRFEEVARGPTSHYEHDDLEKRVLVTEAELRALETEDRRIRMHEEKLRKIEADNFEPFGSDETLVALNLPYAEEGTRNDWQVKLRDIVSSFPQVSKETFDWYKSSEEQLIRRSSELDMEAEKIGRIEKTFRKVGEWYNKRHFVTKLSVGMALGLGAGALMSVSLPAAYACLGVIAMQRTAGMMTMYLKHEKAAPPYGEKREKKFWQWGSKEKAMMKAMLYTVVLGATIKEGVELLSEHPLPETVEKVTEWLKQHYSFGQTEKPQEVSAHGLAGDVIEKGEGYEPASPSESVEVAPPSETSEMPSVTVTATHGRGYEQMVYDMWHKLQEQHLDPSRFNENSDIHKLLTADKHTIKDIAHAIAKDPMHGFFHENALGNTSIGEHAQMHIDSDGNLTFAPTEHSSFAEHAPTDVKIGHHGIHSEPTAPEHQPDTVPDADASNVPSPESFPAPEAVAEYSGVPTHIPELPHGVPDIIPNDFGLVIPSGEAHLYGLEEGAKHVFLKGGSLGEQMKLVAQYLHDFPKSHVYEVGTNSKGAFRVPWDFVDPKHPELGVHKLSLERTSPFAPFSPWKAVTDARNFKVRIK